MWPLVKGRSTPQRDQDPPVENHLYTGFTDLDYNLVTKERLSENQAAFAKWTLPQRCLPVLHHRCSWDSIYFCCRYFSWAVYFYGLLEKLKTWFLGKGLWVKDNAMNPWISEGGAYSIYIFFVILRLKERKGEWGGNFWFFNPMVVCYLFTGLNFHR